MPKGWLYDDGTLIFEPGERSPDVPFRTNFVSHPEELKASLVPSNFKDFLPSYELSTSGHQITTLIWTKEKQIAIYGDWAASRPRVPPLHASLKYSEYLEGEIRRWESFPQEMRQMLARIYDMRNVSGRSWLPKYIEVIFSPYDYAPAPSIEWPKEWPGLSSALANRRDNDLFSVFVPSDKFQKLNSFLATRHEMGAVLIDGKKMSASIRFPFPSEAEWLAK